MTTQKGSLVEQLEQLHSFLVVKSDIQGPTNEFREEANQKGWPQQEHFKIEINVSNMAPESASWPKVVFLGVGIAVFKHHQAPPWAPNGRVVAMPDSSTRLNDVLERPPGGAEFPLLTSNEEKLGVALFAGESATFEYLAPAEDYGTLEFKVLATLSRRHLFHTELAVRL